MIEATLANLRKSADFFDTDQVINIVDGRKKQDIGYFVPKMFKKEFETFLKDLEKRKKIAILKKVASAQKKDPIEEGSVDDGIK